MHGAKLVSAAALAAMIISPVPSVESSSALTALPAEWSSLDEAAIGAAHGSAVRGLPTVIAWGPSPRTVPGILDRVATVAVAAGDRHNLALTRGGSIVAWGSNRYHQVDVPSALDGVTVTQVAVGEGHSLALTANGSVVAWGWNRRGQADVPAALDGVPVAQVAAGGRHSLGITTEGSVVAWGSNRYHQADVPAALDGVVVTQVAAGQARPSREGSPPSHNLALTADGSVVAWGSNRNHQADVPPALDGVVVTQVAAGGRHSLALTEEGSVVAWGANRRGQSDVPVALDGVVATQVAAGETHSLALTEDGSIVAWGDRGRRVRVARVPVILVAARVTQIAAGGRGSLAVGRYEGPDLHVSRWLDGPYELNNAFETDGPFDVGGYVSWSEVVGESFCKRDPFRFYVRVQNDATTTGSVRLRSSSRTPQRVRYHYRGTDITSRLASTAGLVLDIPPARYRSVKMDLTFGRCPYPWPRRTKAFLTAQSVRHPLRIDRVRARVEIYW
jgi:hypothetical protein